MSVLPTANDALRARILSELEMSEDRLKDDAAKLKEWLLMQPHLPHNIDDGLIRSFIIGTKGLEIAKEKLDRYFSVRNAFPIIFAERDPTKFNRDQAVEQFLLPNHTKEGYNVYVLRIKPNTSPSDFDHLETIRRQLVITDYLLSRGLLTSGFVAVYDCAQATASHLTRFNISYNTMALKCYQDNYPLRVKKIILLNAPPLVVKTYENLIKPLIKPKFANKIVVIAPGDKTTLLDHLPEEAVPKDLGGKGPECTVMNDDFYKLLEKERDWCMSNQTWKSDESKRLEKKKFDFDQNYGVEGTFRKLNLD